MQDALITPFTSFVAHISAAVMKLWDSDISSAGKIIWHDGSGFAISVEAGCNGVEAGIVLTAATIAFPSAWKQRLLGIVSGIITIQTLNLIRIITLFYLGQWNKSAFEWAHLYLWQALIMFDVLIVFLFWLTWVSATSPFQAVSEPVGRHDRNQ